MFIQKRILGWAFLSALAMSGSGSADPLTYRTFVGSLNNFNSFGELGFVHATAQDGHPADGNFGAAFDNIVTVNSITIDQRVDAGRHRMRDLRIYTSPTAFITAQLADNQGSQTITLPGAGLTGDYFFITVESLYDAGANDNNPGLHAFTFDGTMRAARTNLNSGIEPTATNQFEPENFFLDVITNGQIVSTTGGPADYLFFEHADTTDRSITVTYGSPQTVASIGVAWEGQIVNSYNTRPVPKFVTVRDSNGNDQQISLAPHTLQYGQYALSTPFTNTTSLTLTLPVGVENYHIPPLFDPGQPTSTLTGVTEFQAFADAVVPPGLDADYNGNGVVDAADYVLWRDGGPLQNEVADLGIVSAADYDAWRGRFGNMSGSGSGNSLTAVPEPNSAALLLLTMMTMMAVAERRLSTAVAVPGGLLAKCRRAGRR